MAVPIVHRTFLLLLLLHFSSVLTETVVDLKNYPITSATSFCRSTPYPEACLSSVKLSVSIQVNPNILTFLLQSLQTALTDAGELSRLFAAAASGHNIVETQRGTVRDCTELNGVTVSAMKKSVSGVKSGKLADAKAYLSGALTNRATCLEALETAAGPMKATLLGSIRDTYQQVSNALSALPRPGAGNRRGRRRLMSADFPGWVSRRDRRILLQQQDDGDGDAGDYDGQGETLTVAADGTGNFTTVTDAVNFAPNNSAVRIFIYVRQGIYQENVEIPSWKPNIVLLGDGRDVTVITGNRSVADGWTTFRSATVAVSGDGFLARDITFENTAGPAKHQAVALRVNSDLAAVYRCAITGFQDSLYVHSFRQFYRECDISGTIDFIFGNAAAAFQGCNIVTRIPLPGQFTVVAAQSRDSPYEATGISIQNCSVLAAGDLDGNSNAVKSFLGRPWRNYSVTVVMESYIGGFIDPRGWTRWAGVGGDDQGLDTLYYGEYQNSGPGSDTDNRVDWAGYHVMEYDDAWNFTVSEFITGDEWLDSTSFPYDDGI
ncbi:unnamed protein product [Cuscuta campestris]|uniref:Pectinesterase n=1 Tax=Cuscuta campestris TaxID=132261 RepID=A0A484MUJ3_9ASTE|nr:unnamed protein product [Cuscuta campestris]